MATGQRTSMSKDWNVCLLHCGIDGRTTQGRPQNNGGTENAGVENAGVEISERNSKKRQGVENAGVKISASLT